MKVLFNIHKKEGDEGQRGIKNDRSLILTLIVTGVLLVLLIISGIGFHVTQKKNFIKRIADELTAVAVLKVKQIADWRMDQLEDAITLVENPLFQRHITHALSGSPSEKVVLLRELLILFQKNNDISEIAILDESGRVRLSLTGTEVISDECIKLIEEAKEKASPVLTDLHTIGDGHQPHISVIIPIFINQDGVKTFRGSIVMIIDAGRFLYPLVQSWPTSSKTAETLLVRKEGDYVLYLNELRHVKDTALKLRIPMTRLDLPAVQAVLGKKGFMEGIDYRGKEVVASLAAVPDSPWYIVSKIDKEEALQGWHVRSLLIFLLVTVMSAGLVAAGMLFWQRERKRHYRELYITEKRMRGFVERQAVTLRAIGDAVIATDREGNIEIMNYVAERLTGWTEGEALGKPLGEVFRIKNEETGKTAEDPVTKVLREGVVVGLANHTLLIDRQGKEVPIADSGAPIKDKDGNITGVVLVFRDQIEERIRQKMMEARLRLINFTRIAETIEEIIKKTIEETINITNSLSGFVYVVERKNTARPSLFWYDRDGNTPFPLKEDRLLDLFKERDEPLVLNDGTSIKEKGLLDDSVGEIARIIISPVVRNGRAVLFLGNLNKKEDYSGYDREVLSYLSDLVWELTDVKQKDLEMVDRERRFREIFENTDVGIAIYEAKDDGKDFVFTDINPSGAKIGGKSREEHIGRSVLEVYPGVKDFGLFKVFQEVWRDGKARLYPLNLYKDGKISLWVENYVCKLSSGEIMAIYDDLTEEKKREEERIALEKQLYQAQRLESIGRLAGGIAHDFNNMLMVISGQTELALMAVDEKHPIKKSLLEIKKAAGRSAALTRQLLAFARKQTISPKVLDLNETVEGMLKMLRRLIGEDIELIWIPGRNLWAIKMDPAQMDQILSNLIVNARDAISGHGSITIETENVTLDEDYCSIHAGFIPGDYVTLIVSDTGSGMDRETIERIFEPFFTTKDTEKGTGLGLATVYGIVKQNRGFINVYSEIGIGSTFKIYIPAERERGTQEGEMEKEASFERATPGKTILLVEDEPSILDVGRKMLEGLGYYVLAAGNPHEAMEIAKNHKGKISLLITDVVMPGMDGRELSKKLMDMFPDMKCLFMSGYTANAIAHHNILEEGLVFIQKPFSMSELSIKVKEALGVENNGD
ncbi:MAG: ATP-binding protein [Syntrophorhabdaceae bacterium]|nr:ATP-binding protein [Syntrophorhabdaceae bacterium]